MLKHTHKHTQLRVRQNSLEDLSDQQQLHFVNKYDIWRRVMTEGRGGVLS